MKNLNMNAQNADLNSTNNHRFCYDWKLGDLKNVEKTAKRSFLVFPVAAAVRWDISWQDSTSLGVANLILE